MRVRLKQDMPVGDFIYREGQVVSTADEFTASAVPLHIAHGWADSGFADRLDDEEVAVLTVEPEAAVTRSGKRKRGS